MSAEVNPTIPKAFVWKRVHSLLGLWLVIYLIEHLVTNSQAALWLGDNGIGFVRLVNFYHSLPYLQVIEISILGIPILLHGIIGIQSLLTSKSNSRKTDGTKPSMRYGRSRAYTWQRYTAWILMLGILLHVIQMRFIDKPKKVSVDQKAEYLIKLNLDEGLYTLSDRLHVSLYSKDAIDGLKAAKKASFPESITSPDSATYNSKIEKRLRGIQDQNEYANYVSALKKFSLSDQQVIAAATTPGDAILLAVRNTFKNPWMCAFYTLFVLSACFHGFNGFWTFLITWGVILSFRSQKTMVHFAYGLMFIIAFLGLAAIWGSYWVNLRM